MHVTVTNLFVCVLIFISVCVICDVKWLFYSFFFF